MRTTGFSLLELMVTLAILALALTFALPDGHQALVRNQTRTTAAQLQLALNAARALAITSGVPASVCASVDLLSCTRTLQWQGDALLFSDFNSDGERQTTEPILQVFALGRNSVFSTAGRPIARFQPEGHAGGSNLTLTVCELPQRATRLIVANGGRIRIERDRPEARC